MSITIESLTACLFEKYHCVKSVQIPSFFWSAFSRIWTEYEEMQSISPYSVLMREKYDSEKLRIWTLFTQCMVCIVSRKVLHPLNWKWN